MTPRKIDSHPFQIRSIHRQQVRQRLAIAALIALLTTGCASSSKLPKTSAQSPVVTNQNASDQIQAVFYQNTQQCQADVKKQQEEYTVLKKAFQEKKLARQPNAPLLKASDCDAQMLAAQQEHNRNAPVYASLADCQADGVQCEATPASYSTSGYRPSFGGSYFYPYGMPDYVYVDYGGSRHRVYQPRTVYRSQVLGQVITPYGRVVKQTSSGQVTVPRHTSVSAPKRPSGTSGRGTITGRSSQGFGSTYKSTGSGGK